MKISRWFTLEEALSSEAAERNRLDNSPSTEVAVCIVYTALHMDKVRDFLGYPILPTSWHRTLEVNRAVGSKRDDSQHIRGEAMDWKCPGFGSPVDIVKKLAPKIKEFRIDQLILEYTWVHASFAINPPREPRGQILTLLSNGKYASGITDKTGKLI